MIDFRPGGPADVRSQNINPETDRSKDGSLSRQQLTDIGNYNFGVAGAANGYDLNTLTSAGDYDQYVTGKHDCWTCWPKDNPQDREMIEQGFSDQKDGSLFVCPIPKE